MEKSHIINDYNVEMRLPEPWPTAQSTPRFLLRSHRRFRVCGPVRDWQADWGSSGGNEATKAICCGEKSWAGKRRSQFAGQSVFTPAHERRITTKRTRLWIQEVKWFVFSPQVSWAVTCFTRAALSFWFLLKSWNVLGRVFFFAFFLIAHLLLWSVVVFHFNLQDKCCFFSNVGCGNPLIN